MEKDRFIVPCRFAHIWLMDEYIEADYPIPSDYNEFADDIDYTEYLVILRKNNIEFGGTEYFDYEGNLLDKMEVYRKEYHKQIGMSEG